MKRLALAALPVLALLIEGPPAKAQSAAAPQAPAAAAPATPAPAAKPALTVADAAFGTAVEQRALTGQAESFPAGTKRVYCFTRLTGGAGQEVTHAWYHGDAKVSEVKLAANFPTTSTWSYKSIPAGATGAWRVDVLGPDGVVLATRTFTVQ